MLYKWYKSSCCYCGKQINVKMPVKLVFRNRDMLMGNACYSCIPENCIARNGIDESAYDTRERGRC